MVRLSYIPLQMEPCRVVVDSCLDCASIWCVLYSVKVGFVEQAKFVDRDQIFCCHFVERLFGSQRALLRVDRQCRQHRTSVNTSSTSAIFTVLTCTGLCFYRSHLTLRDLTDLCKSNFDVGPVPLVFLVSRDRIKNLLIVK